MKLRITKGKVSLYTCLKRSLSTKVKAECFMNVYGCNFEEARRVVLSIKKKLKEKKLEQF